MCMWIKRSIERAFTCHSDAAKCTLHLIPLFGRWVEMNLETRFHGGRDDPLVIDQKFCMHINIQEIAAGKLLEPLKT